MPPPPVSQEAKAVPALNRTLDLVTFATLIRPLVDTRTEAGATRALRLWAEMHARGIAADGALVGTMITACERTPSLGAEVRTETALLLFPPREAQPRRGGKTD